MALTQGASKDPVDAGYVYWVSKLGGEVIGRLPFERQGDDVLSVTPTPLRNLSQDRLEPILVDALKTSRGAGAAVWAAVGRCNRGRRRCRLAPSRSR